jgi:hypothetical protein
VHVRRRSLFGSFLVALFFNNFLPSNIGGDVIRIGDTAKPAGSKTLAATVVLVDRGLGTDGTGAGGGHRRDDRGKHAAGRHPDLAVMAVGGIHHRRGRVGARRAGAGRLRTAAATADRVAPGVGEQPHREVHRGAGALPRPSGRPGRLLWRRVFVQSTIVVFYFLVAQALRLDITFWDLAVIVPMSFVVQMLPVSLNGFGLREATFAFYFTRIGQPLEHALLVSLVPTALMMLFSLTGAAVYVSRSGGRMGIRN